MATCPRCYEYLDEHHVCRRGQTSRKIRGLLKAFVALIVGALAGGYVLGLIGSATGFPQLTIFGAVTGAVVAYILVHSLRSRRTV